MSTVGIFGAGELTQSYYLPALVQSGLFSTILITDTETKRIQECTSRFLCTGASGDELLQQCSDIIIATPPATHAQLLERCMAPGKHILCEKPVLLCIEELNTLIHKSYEQKCSLYGAHIRRLFPAIASAKAFIQNQKTGALKRVEIFEGGRYTYATRSGYHISSPAGGVWADTGAHALDAAFYLCGLADNNTDVVYSFIKRDKPEPAHHIEAQFQLQEIEFIVKLSRYHQLSNKVNLYFENYTIEVPLWLHPFFTVWEGQNKHVYPCEFLPAYLPQAFRMELNEVFIKHNSRLLGIDQFSLVTRVLEAGLAHT